MLSGIYCKHSTAQSAPNKAANQVRADQSATTQVSRQSWRELRARMSSVVEYFLFTSLCSRTKKLNLPGLPNMQPLTKKSHAGNFCVFCCYSNKILPGIYLEVNCFFQQKLYYFQYIYSSGGKHALRKTAYFPNRTCVAAGLTY